MNGSFSAIVVWAAVLGCVVPITEGCARHTGDATESAGTLELSLVATSANGTTYRLREATFNVSGTQSASLSTEDDPDATTLGVDLRAGDYLVRLASGWRLERAAPGGEFSPINATLISTNPVAFTVHRDQTTNVRFTFAAGEDVVEFGTGAVAIDIAVVDEQTGGGGNGSGGGGGAGNVDGLVLWNTLGSMDELTHSRVGPNGARISYPDDSNAWSAGFGEGLYGGGLTRSEVGYTNTPNEFFHFGDDAVAHSGINIRRGCVEFWWKAVDFGDWVGGYFFHASASSSERADEGGPSGYPCIILGWNSWDYGEGNLRTMSAGVYYGGGDTLVELTNRFSATFEPNRWYHLAVSWDVDGIPGDPQGHRVAIYRDGEKWSAVVVEDTWTMPAGDAPYVRSFWMPGTRPSEYGSGGAFYANLWGTYDNLKAWNYAKTDFSDRFVE